MKNLNRSYIKFIIPILLIILIVFPEFTPFISEILKRNSPKVSGYNPNLPNYLYLNYVEQTTYDFNAKDESYILAEIDGIDFTSFELDGVTYNISYGLNIFSKDFGLEFDSYTITFKQNDIDNSIFKWFCIEPLYLAQDNIVVNMTEYYETQFKAGGSISILMKPNFSYNYLYLDILEFETERIIMKHIFEPNGDIPEVQSQFYSYLVKGGVYTRFDINLKPGIHKMRVLGKGSIDYKIIVNFDWDDDSIHDVDEVQKESFLDIDPVKPNIWGFFERGNTVSFNDQNESIGVFTFFIPDTYNGLRYLSIDVYSGKFWDVQVDEDTLTLKDMELRVDPYAKPISQPYGCMSPGWHNIYYKCNSSLIAAKISFRIDHKPIVILDVPEFSDHDSDGLKDIQERNSGLSFNSFDYDSDGLPDGLDASPLSFLKLSKNLMHQMVIPHDPGKNTIINLAIKKPETDYSTYDTSRIWMKDYEYGGGLEVFIQPIMRLFGNATIHRDDLVSFWKGNSSNIETFSLLEGDFSGVGDTIPDEEDPNAEFMFFYPKPSEEVYEFDITFEKGHPAKSDNAIDLRFDFVWLISSPNATGNMQVIHYYDINEDIILQSFVSREIDEVNYIIGSPDSMIENQILWNLVQNNQLGSLNNFGVSNDVVGMGTVDYFDLATQTVEVRRNHPLLCDSNGNPLETEVLYVAGLQKNNDLLNKIYIKENNLDVSFEVNHSGDYEAYFSFYSVSNVYGENTYTVDDEEIRGQSKVCYSITWNNYTEGKNRVYQQRTNIEGFPINMEIKEFGEVKVLKVKQIMGEQIPLPLPINLDDFLHDKIILHNQTFIEELDFSTGVPTINFDETKDIYKEFFDARSRNVIKGDIFFKRYSLMDARIFQRLINRLINNLESLIIDCKIICDFYYDAVQWGINIPSAAYYQNKWYEYMDELGKQINIWVENLNNIVDDLDVDKLLKDIRDTFLKFTSDQDYSDIREAFSRLEGYVRDDDLTSGLYKNIKGDTDKHFTQCIDSCNDISLKCDELKDNADPFGRLRCWFKNHQINSKIKLGAIGTVTIVVGAVVFTYGLMETFKLISEWEKGDFTGRELEFAARLTQSIATTVLGGITLIYGVLIFLGPVSNFKIVSQNAFNWASKWLSRIMTVIAVIIAVFDIAGQLIEAWETYGFSNEFTLEVIEITIKAGLQYLVPIILAATGHSGWGIIVGIIAAIGIYIWDWLTGANKRIVKTYEPCIEIIEEENGEIQTYFTFPRLQIKKHGSLEPGDEVALRMKIRNNGTCVSYFQAKFAAGGSEFTEYQGNWTDGYAINATDILEFTRTLPVVAPNLITVLNISIDSNIPSRTRIFDSEDLIWINIPIMDHNIEDFYAQTTPLSKPADHEKLIELYEKALKEYQYKDAEELLEKLRYRVAYDFLLDIDGTEPDGWQISSLIEESFVKVVSNKSGHNKVVQLHHDLDFQPVMYQSFSKISHGTVEFWVYTENDKCNFYVTLHDPFYSLESFLIRFGANKHISYWVDTPGWGSEYRIIKEWCFYPKKWYNVRIDFEFKDDGYCGLSNDTFNLWLDGIKIGRGIPIHRPGNGIDTINFETNHCYKCGWVNTDVYLDMIDYSWSNGYYIGRSFNWNYTWDDIIYYQDLYNDLPIKTNINTSLYEDIIEINPDNGYVLTEFLLNLEGPGDFFVDYEFSIQENSFNIDPPTLAQVLEDPIILNISTNNPHQFGGIYYFEMNIRLPGSGELIYKEAIPFRIPFVKDFQWDQFKNIKFVETFDMGYWDLYNVADRVIYIDNIPTDDSYVSDYYPNANFGDKEYLRIWFEQVGPGLGDVKKEVYIKWESPYLFSNYTAPSTLYCYVSSYDSDSLYIYNTTNFYEHSITWNNRPDTLNLLNIVDPGSWGWKEIELGNPCDYYKLCVAYSTYGSFQIQSSECEGVEPHIRHYLSKNYHGNGLIYMQSDVEELLSLKSPIYPSFTDLKMGDLIVINCTSTTSNEIVLALINNGKVVKNYTIIPKGNFNFENQIVRIPVLEDLSFNQLLFSGHSQEGYFAAYDITVLDYNLATGESINPMNFTNYGNVPEFVEYDYHGGVSQSETDLKDYEVIMPGDHINCLFNLTVVRADSNLLYRQIIAKNPGTFEVYVDYLEIFGIEGIFLNSPQGRSFNIYGLPFNMRDGLSLDYLSEESLVWSAYSLDNNPNITIFESNYLTNPDFFAQFEENDGSITYDSIHSLDGILRGNTEWDVGKQGSSLYFDGNGDDVNFGPILEDIFGDTSTSFTITAWIYPTALTSAKSNHKTANCFLAKASDPKNDNIELGITTDGKLHVYLDTKSKDTYANYGISGSIPTNEWTFIAVRYENGNVDVLIDDSWYYTSDWGLEPWSGATILDQAVGSLLTLGSTDHRNTYFTGYLDEIAIYKNMLDDITIENSKVPQLINYLNSIPIPEVDGLHSIQLFGRNLQNNILKSEKHYFTVNYPIKIFEPRNISYNLQQPRNCTFGSIVTINEYKYSLDGQEQIEITDNFDFELPHLDNGWHSLIIYGIDSHNHEYHSEMRYFTVNSPIIWEEDFSSFESYMLHDFYPDDYNNIFSMNPLYMKNNFPKESFQDEWANWNLNYDNNYISASFSNGIFNSQLNSGTSTYAPAQPGDFSMIKGTSNWLGDLEFRDTSFTTFTSTDIPPNVQYINSIYYNYGNSGSGTLDNTHYDNSAYKQILPEWNKMLQAYILGVELKFNPALSGRNFRLHLDIVTSGGYTGLLKVNGQTIRSGSTIDENNIIINDVNKIEFYVLQAAESSFNVKIYYFKLEVLNPNPLFIYSISYNYGYFYTGTLSNTHSDDSNYYGMRPQKTFDSYYLAVNFNFDPSLNGNDFLLSIYIKSTGADSTNLKVNGQTIRSGEIIDENNIILENVNSISFNAYRWLESFTSRIYYFKLVPIDMGADLEFDCTIKLGNIHPEDTLNNLELYYSYKTDHNQLVKLKLWNYGTSNWDIIDNNIYSEFTDHYNSIPNNYYNQNYEIKVKFEGLDDNTQFHLFIDQLVVNYDWVTTSGNIYSTISKAISYDFLNCYDSGYPNYQNFYEITLTFDYKFIDSLPFPTYSAFSCQDNSFNLIKDGNWHTFSHTFDFDSQVLNEFNINFNISNGCLELNNLNYDIRFKCLNPSGEIILQQSFYLEWLNSEDLSSYNQLYLNITYDLNTVNDNYDYYNTFGRQNKLEIKYEIKADGMWKSFIYSVNNSEYKQSNFDITQFMLDNGLNNFEDFRITFTIIGENTELTVSNIMLYGYN